MRNGMSRFVNMRMHLKLKIHFPSFSLLFPLQSSYRNDSKHKAKTISFRSSIEWIANLWKGFNVCKHIKNWWTQKKLLNPLLLLFPFFCLSLSCPQKKLKRRNVLKAAPKLSVNIIIYFPRMKQEKSINLNLKRKLHFGFVSSAVVLMNSNWIQCVSALPRKIGKLKSMGSTKKHETDGESEAYKKKPESLEARGESWLWPNSIFGDWPSLLIAFLPLPLVRWFRVEGESDLVQFADETPSIVSDQLDL